MTLKEVLYVMKSDLYRYYGKTSLSFFLKTYLLHPGFRYSLVFRLSNYFYHKKFFIILYWITLWKLHRLQYKFSIVIPRKTKIGSGLYIGHFSNIIVNENAVLGNNINLSPGVGIAQANRGKNKGTPTIGNNVYIGPGAKIVGKIKIGNNVCIGTNSVVVHDIPDNAVISGVPATTISFNGVAEYINYIDY